MKQGFGLSVRLGHASFNRFEELGEILSKEILTNKQGKCRLIQSSGILSIYLFRRHDIIYSFSFSYHFFFHATLRFTVGLQLARIKKHTSLETIGTVLLFYPSRICSLFFFISHSEMRVDNLISMSKQLIQLR